MVREARTLIEEAEEAGVPSGWSRVRLGDLGDLATSSVNKKTAADEEAVFLVNYMDVYQRRFIDSELDLMRVTARASRIERSQVKPGDVLFTPSSETPDDIGHSAVVIEELSDTLHSYHTIRLRPNGHYELDRRFLGWFANAGGVRRQFERRASGTTRFTLNLKDFRDTTVLLPPLPEQKKIAAILSSVDDAIAATLEVIEQTKRVKKGLLQDLMTQGIGHTRFKKTEIGEIPEEWEVVQLASLIKSLNPGVSVKSQDRTIEGNEVGVLKTGAVSEGRFLPSEHKVVLPEERDRVRVSPKAGRIIISRMNTRQLVGESGLVREDHPKLFLPDRLWQTEFYRSADFNPEWLALALTAPPIRERIRLLGTGTSGSMKNIAQTKFLSLKIPYPPTNEQQEMATAVRALQHTSVRAEKSVAKLSQLKRGLMQDLLTGRVRVRID